MARVTLQSIADRVGVSRMTVSNAFSRPDQLSTALRDRILSAAEELGYSGPDPAARALARGRTGSVGLLLTDRLSVVIGDALAGEFIAAVSDELAGQGMAVTLLAPTETDGVVEAEVAMDGLLVYVCGSPGQQLEWARRRGLPIVTVDQSSDRRPAQHQRRRPQRRPAGRPAPRRPRPQTDRDPHPAGRRGRERPRGRRGHGARAHARLALGPRARGHRALGRPRASTCSPSRRTPPRGSSSTGPTDRPRCSASPTRSRSRCCERPPISGSGSPRTSRWSGTTTAGSPPSTRPPLTTIRQDVVAKGRLAVTALVRAINDPDSGPPERLVLPAELVVRASTAPPPVD